MHGPSGQQQASPPCDPSEQQALAVFNHAAEEIRFFKGQQWRVTNYALLAYAALAAAPRWMGAWKGYANALCSVAVIFAGLVAWRVLRSLNEAHAKERRRMERARREKLSVVAELHANGSPIDGRATGRIVWIMGAALVIGAVLAILINLSRIPQVVACISQLASGEP
jgi:hypothetical protein